VQHAADSTVAMGAGADTAATSGLHSASDGHGDETVLQHLERHLNLGSSTGGCANGGSGGDASAESFARRVGFVEPAETQVFLKEWLVCFGVPSALIDIFERCGDNCRTLWRSAICRSLGFARSSCAPLPPSSSAGVNSEWRVAHAAEPRARDDGWGPAATAGRADEPSRRRGRCLAHQVPSVHCQPRENQKSVTIIMLGEREWKT